MNKFRKALILLIFIAMAAVLSSCSADAPSHPSDSSLTLRTYTVPPSDAETLSAALNHVLGLDNYNHDIGRTYVSGPGQVLVLAPAHLQDSIANSIEQIVSQNKIVTSPRPLRLNVWIVDVYQGVGAVDPNLRTIQPALQSFEEDSGPAHFLQTHYFTAVSDSGADTTMSPLPYYDLGYSITNNGDRLMLKFDYRQHFVRQPAETLSGQVTTRLGQTLVLGLLAGRPADAEGNSKVGQTADGAQQAGVKYKLLVMRIVPAAQD